MCAFDLPTTEIRDRVRKIAFDNGLLILGCGTSTLRFRPRLAITEDELDEGMGILTEVLSDL